MKPIITIDDFSEGIVDDETLATTTGFSMVRGIDLKNELGVAKLANSWTTFANLQSANNFVLWEIDNRPNTLTGQDGLSQLYASNNPVSGVEIKNLRVSASSGYDFGNYKSSGNTAPVYHEIAVYNNRLVFCDWTTGIGTQYGWTTGDVASLTATNWSTTVSINTSPSTGCDPIWAYAAGGTLYLDRGTGVWDSYSISSVNVGAQTMVIASPYGFSTGARRAFVIAETSNGYARKSSTVTCTLTGQNKTFRPMLEFQRRLFVWDGNYVATLDADDVADTATWNPATLDIGKDYRIKSIRAMGSYLYILADKKNNDYYNSFSNQDIGNSDSYLFVWDWFSEAVSNVIPIWTTCYSIYVSENRLYAVVRKYSQGSRWNLALAYFNGSDFPVLKTIRVNGTVFPNGMAYDRGKFYIGISGTDYDGNDASGVWTFSQYSNEASVLAFEYPCGKVGAVYVGELKTGYSTTERSVFFSGQSSEYAMTVNSNVQASGYIETQTYEITPNQFGQIVRGTQANFSKTLPSGTSANFAFRGDEDTSYTQFATVTSSNQSNLQYGVSKRYRKAKFKITLNGGGGSGTPRLIKVSAY